MGEATLRIDGPVAQLTISAPETRNALTWAIARQISEICDAIDAEKTVGAAVIKGAEGTFCSGANTHDWESIHADPAADESFQRLSAVYGAFLRLGDLKVPTVAAVRGSAVGGGMNLLLAADVRIVALDARLLAGFLRRGVHPGGGFFTLAARAGGRETAAALGLFGEVVSGARAAELGLAWEAVPDQDVERRALELARAAAVDPELTRRAVATYRSELASSVPWPMAVELERGAQMWSQRRRSLRKLEM